MYIFCVHFVSIVCTFVLYCGRVCVLFYMENMLELNSFASLNFKGAGF